MLPMIVGEIFEDGFTINAMPKCESKYNKDGCKNFYEKLYVKEDGFYQCPSGYSVYKKTLQGEVVFYSGLRIKGYYNRKKQNVCVKNTIISAELFEKLLLANEQLNKAKNELQFEKEIQKDLLHDVRKLDGLIKTKTEELINLHQHESEESDLYSVIQKVKNISAMEELITCKYSVYDLVSNIDVLSMGNKVRVSVYRKFDKVRYTLLDYKNKGIKIRFEGETDFKYDVNLMYFEVLPFLVLENAVKYSPQNKEVVVKFTDDGSELKIEIKSYGPYCKPDEIDRLFQKNYRGEIAKRTSSEGTGVGLFLVKQICDQHGIQINIESNYNKKSNGIPYGEFIVNLLF